MKVKLNLSRLTKTELLSAMSDWFLPEARRLEAIGEARNRGYTDEVLKLGQDGKLPKDWESHFSFLKPTDPNKGTSNDKGTVLKYDADKVRLELVPPELLYAVGTVAGFGAKKYTDHGWAAGMAWGRMFGACMRHLWSWWGGKGPTTKSFAFGELDAETGFSHLWHAACCIAFLVAYEERNVGEDDRYGSTEKV